MGHRCFMWVRQVTKILFVMFPRLRASTRHGGARRFQYLVSLKRRGGVPSGAAAFIIFGGMGASAPILIIYPIHALPIRFSEEPSIKIRSGSINTQKDSMVPAENMIQPESTTLPETRKIPGSMKNHRNNTTGSRKPDENGSSFPRKAP